MSKYNTNKNKYLAKSERASVPKITKKQKGSITIEAAFAIPLFLFAALCLIWMIEIQSIKIGVKQAAYSAAKSAGGRYSSHSGSKYNQVKIRYYSFTWKREN